MLIQLALPLLRDDQVLAVVLVAVGHVEGAPLVKQGIDVVIRAVVGEKIQRKTAAGAAAEEQRPIIGKADFHFVIAALEGQRRVIQQGGAFRRSAVPVEIEPGDERRDGAVMDSAQMEAGGIAPALMIRVQIGQGQIGTSAGIGGLVHDFIYQGVLSVLQQQLETPLPLDDEPQPAPRSIPENRVAAGRNHFAEPAAREPVAPRYTPAPASGSRPAAPWPNAQPGYQKQQGEVYRQLLQTPAPMQKPKAPEPQEPALAANSQSFGRVLTIVHSDCALLERDGNISLLSLPVAERWLRQAQLTPGEAPVCAQPLLIPLRLKVSAEEKSALEKAQSALAELGIDFQSDAQHVTIRAVPLPLRQQNLQILIPELIGYLAKQSVFEPGNIAQWIARNLMSEHAQWSMAQAITLLADVERLCPQLVKTPPGGLLQSVDLHPAIKALKDE